MSTRLLKKQLSALSAENPVATSAKVSKKRRKKKGSKAVLESKPQPAADELVKSRIAYYEKSMKIEEETAEIMEKASFLAKSTI